MALVGAAPLSGPPQTRTTGGCRWHSSPSIAAHDRPACLSRASCIPVLEGPLAMFSFLASCAPACTLALVYTGLHLSTTPPHSSALVSELCKVGT